MSLNSLDQSKYEQAIWSYCFKREYLKFETIRDNKILVTDYYEILILRSS